MSNPTAAQPRKVAIIFLAETCPEDVVYIDDMRIVEFGDNGRAEDDLFIYLWKDGTIDCIQDDTYVATDARNSIDDNDIVFYVIQ